MLNSTQQQSLTSIESNLGLLQQLKNSISFLREKEGNQFKEKLFKLHKSFERELLQFKSGTPIIISTGMLKAGKSTLVNLLARTTLASPTGYGIDTTLRPALIRMSKQDDTVTAKVGEIVIYYNEGGDRDTLLGYVLDQLRGIDTTKNESRNLREKHLELNKTNLREILCKEPSISKELEQEPLIVVITTPFCEDAKLLQNGCMLLDMPGLDSNTAEVSKNNGKSDYKRLIGECDLLLFVQSSVAPLNQDASELLRDIMNTRSEGTTTVVQNLMRAKAWTEKERLEKEENEQSDHAINIIKKHFPDNNSIRCFTVNLGMAYDAKFMGDDFLNKNYYHNGETKVDNKDDLLHFSDFENLEKGLYDSILNNNINYRLRTCCRGLKKQADEYGDTIKELKRAIEVKVESLRKELQAWGNLRSQAEAKRVVRFIKNNAHIQLNKSAIACDISSAVLKKHFPDIAMLPDNDTACVKGSKVDEIVKKCKDCYSNMIEQQFKQLRLTDFTIEVEDLNSGTRYQNVAFAEGCNALREHTDDLLKNKEEDSEVLKACKNHLRNQLNTNILSGTDTINISTDGLNDYTCSQYKKLEKPLYLLGFTREVKYKKNVWKDDKEAEKMQHHYESEEIRLLKDHAVSAFDDALRKKMEDFINKYQSTADAKIQEIENQKQLYEKELEQIKEMLFTINNIHNLNNEITR